LSIVLFCAWSDSSPSATQLSSNWSRKSFDIREVSSEAVVEQIHDVGEALYIKLLLAARSPRRTIAPRLSQTSETMAR